MFAKKLVFVTASGFMLSAASAAFADPPDWAPAHGWRARHQHEVMVHHRSYYGAPVYYAPRSHYYEPAYTYYAPAPAYTYYAPAPTYYAPAPVYYGPGAATVGGAVVGAIIGNQISDRRHRGAATAAGALVGAFVGSQLEYGY